MINPKFRTAAPAVKGGNGMGGGQSTEGASVLSYL